MADSPWPRAGDLRHQLQYQVRQPQARDAYGKAGPGWTTVGTYWGSVRQLGGREAANAERLKITATHKVTTRYFPGASAEGRFLWNGVGFAIESVDNVEMQGVAYEFLCTRVENPPQ